MHAAELDRARAEVLAGRPQAALDIAGAALTRNQGDLQALLLRIKALRLCKRFAEARAAIASAEAPVAALGVAQAVAEVRFEHGMLLMDQGHLDEALPQFLETARLGEANPIVFGAISDTLCRLDRPDEAVEWRTKVLRLRDKEVSCQPHEVISAGRPRAFDPGRPERNIVSYCLFGSDRYYRECAITNARMTPILFPEFTARFYCAPDTPQDVLAALSAAGAQVLLARSPKGAGISPMAGTLWRFLSFDDPGVDVVLCRDVDSPILPRERAAIDLWLSTDKPFYVLRDHAVHAELMLAGMWGGFTGLLPPLGPLADALAASHASRFVDQIFLRTVIWPRLRDKAVLQIDSIASLPGSVDFPDGYPKRGRQHVGMGWTREQILGPLP